MDAWRDGDALRTMRVVVPLVVIFRIMMTLTPATLGPLLDLHALLAGGGGHCNTIIV